MQGSVCGHMITGSESYTCTDMRINHLTCMNMNMNLLKLFLFACFFFHMHNYNMITWSGNKFRIDVPIFYYMLKVCLQLDILIIVRDIYLIFRIHRQLSRISKSSLSSQLSKDYQNGEERNFNIQT